MTPQSMESQSDKCSSASSFTSEYSSGPINLPSCSWSDVHVRAKIGNGAFAMVLKVTTARALPPSSTGDNYNDNHQVLALKHVKLGELDSNTGRQAMDDLQEEARILSRLNHPHIVTIVAQGHIPQDDSFFFLMECLQQDNLRSKLCEWRRVQTKLHKMKYLPRLFKRRVLKRLGGGGGTAATNVDEHSKKLSSFPPSLFERLYSIGYRLGQALDYIHQKHIIHNDIKPENVGFDTFGGHVKLFDFGLSRDLSNKSIRGGDDDTSTVLAGSIRYMAPECLLAYPSSFGSDVYAFGILLWELVTLEIPHKDVRDIAGIMDKVVHKEETLSLDGIESTELRNVLQSCWSTEPNNRPNSERLVDNLANILNEMQQRRPNGDEENEHGLDSEKYCYTEMTSTVSSCEYCL